jgi:lantibiotic modifying enzyme
VAGIIYFLLEYGERYHDQDALTSAQRGLHWLIKKSVKKNGKLLWLSAADKEISPWWCEGAPGIALSFMKAYLLLKDVKYKEYATGALLNHDKYVINNNLSQCHGLAGLGEVYLEAFRTFKEEEWYDRADWIMQVIMQLKKQHKKYGPYWIVQSERQPVADFMIGNSGVLHFLLRYCFPDNISFPLLQ